MIAWLTLLWFAHFLVGMINNLLVGAGIVHVVLLASGMLFNFEQERKLWALAFHEEALRKSADRFIAGVGNRLGHPLSRADRLQLAHLCMEYVTHQYVPKQARTPKPLDKRAGASPSEEGKTQ